MGSDGIGRFPNHRRAGDALMLVRRNEVSVIVKKNPDQHKPAETYRMQALGFAAFVGEGAETRPAPRRGYLAPTVAAQQVSLS